MPWAPELFSAPTLERLQKNHRHELEFVPYFDGLLSGELDAMVESFADEPELHHPLRGRVKGERAFRAFVAEMNAWLAEHDAIVEGVAHAVTAEGGFEEVVLDLDGEAGRVGLPHALVADR